MAHIYPKKIIHPDVEVSELEERLAALADENDETRQVYERPLERKLEAAKARQAERQRQVAAAETMTPRELAAQVPR